jgi:hypothetical protein
MVLVYIVSLKFHALMCVSNVPNNGMCEDCSELSNSLFA